MKPKVLTVLDGRRGRRLVGADHIHGNVNRAVEAQLADESDRAQDSSQSFAGSS